MFAILISIIDIIKLNIVGAISIMNSNNKRRMHLRSNY